MSTTSANGRIAKNTLILYVRMLVLMLVSLYTSRIVLDALGVDDYGIYNVVGGIVTVFGFLNGTLSTASARFITMALGKGDIGNMRKVFSSTLWVNALLALVVVILSETIGLWFLYNKIVIPEGRMGAAFWVYQVSVVSIVLNIISVPYNATIIAHERMSAFAYITLFDAFAKLCVAFLLTYDISVDKLIAYAVLICIINIIDRIVYGLYCAKKFPETKLQLLWDKSLLKEMGQFIGWSSYGSLVTVGCTQGLNILLNMFFGTAVNAARALSVQVQSAVVGFANNFQVAVNPQITKSYACGNFNETKRLLIVSSKLSFFLMCLIGVPLVVNADSILSIWLKTVPEHSLMFVRIMVIIGIFQTLAYPVRIVNQAEGNIKKFQLLECTYLALIVPLSYVALKIGAKPETVFIIQLIIEVTAQFIRVVIVLPKVDMTILQYLKVVYLRVTPAFFIPFVLSLYIKSLMEPNLITFIINLVISEMLTLMAVFFVGLGKVERKQIVAKLRFFIGKKSDGGVTIKS